MNYPFLLHLRARGKHMHECTEWPKNSIRGCAMWPLLMIWKQMLLVGRCPSGRRRRDKQTGTLTKMWNISVGIFGISNLNWIELNCNASLIDFKHKVSCLLFGSMLKSQKPKHGKEYLSVWVTGLLSESKIQLTIWLFILALMNRREASLLNSMRGSHAYQS